MTEWHSLLDYKLYSGLIYMISGKELKTNLIFVLKLKNNNLPPFYIPCCVPQNNVLLEGEKTMIKQSMAYSHSEIK